MNFFFDLIKATYFFLGGNTENRSNGKGHGDSHIVISDNGGIPRAALREAVMTKATPATIVSVNASGLWVCVLPSQCLC